MWKKPDLPAQVCCAHLCQVPVCSHCHSTSQPLNQGQKISVIDLLWFWEAHQEMCHAHPPEKCSDPPLLSSPPQYHLRAVPAAGPRRYWRQLLGESSSPPSLVQHYPCQATGVNSGLQLHLSPRLPPCSVA